MDGNQIFSGIFKKNVLVIFFSGLSVPRAVSTLGRLLSVDPPRVLTCNKHMPMYAAEQRADEPTPGFLLSVKNRAEIVQLISAVPSVSEQRPRVAVALGVCGEGE